MGLELEYGIPADGVTAFESEMWEEMDTNPDKFETKLRGLVHAAMDHIQNVGSRGIMSKQTLAIRLAQHLMAVMSDTQTTALTWTRVGDGKWSATRGAVQGALNMVDGILRAGNEGWMICECQEGRLKGMTLQHKRTMAFMRKNDLMVVVMTTLAAMLRGALVRSIHNWWIHMSNNRKMVGLCKQCKKEVAGDCEKGLCEECCRSNRYRQNLQCCEGGYGSSSDEVAALMEIPGFMERDGTSGRMNNKARDLLMKEGMVEKQQQDGRNCIFEALSDAAGMRPGKKKDLQRKVVKRVRVEHCHDMFEK